MPGSSVQPMLFRVRFVIVNGFTGLNLLVGILALIAASLNETRWAAYGLLLCVLLDGCDGTLARRWQVTSAFGAQLDSLADMTSFMVAGATLIFFWLHGTLPFELIVAVSALYALMGAVRLARFNSSAPNPHFFEGVPTTVVAGLLAANYLAAQNSDNAYAVVALVVLFALLMVSRLPYPKLTTIQRYTPRWLWAMILLAAVFQFAWTVWALTAVYSALGPSIWMYRRLHRANVD